MRHIYMILWAGWLAWTPLYAQNKHSEITTERYKYADEIQLWKYTLNPAGLSVDTLIIRGQTSFSLSSKHGDYYRVQEGRKRNELSFFSEQYKKLGAHLVGYGSVRFEMGRIFDRSWSDVMRTYESNPYISGSSIAGRYDFQNFSLNASLATVSLGGFTYGLRLDYAVGDLSRLKDPRSRSNLVDYRLIPGVTYSRHKHTWGVNAFYHRRKEKIPGITTVQTDPTLKYYTFEGLEHVTGTVGGYSSFGREYVHHEFGGELTYQYRTSVSTTLLTTFYNRGNEDVWEEMKYAPGVYETLDYGLRIGQTFLGKSGLHRVRLSAKYAEGAADQFRQEKITEKDSATGIASSRWETLIRYDNRYLYKAFDVDLDYRYTWLDPATTPKGYVGVRVQHHSVKNTYNPPYSHFRHKNVHLSLEGGYVLRLKAERSLWIEPKVAYHSPSATTLQLNDETTDYAVEVLLPDMLYYGSRYVQAGLQLNYQWGCMIKRHHTKWFVKADAGYLKAGGNRENIHIGFTLGLLH